MGGISKRREVEKGIPCLCALKNEGPRFPPGLCRCGTDPKAFRTELWHKPLLKSQTNPWTVLLWDPNNTAKALKLERMLEPLPTDCKKELGWLLDMTKNSAFKKDSESQHNTQNVDNSTPKWLTCRKLGKCFQFLKKKKRQSTTPKWHRCWNNQIYRSNFNYVPGDKGKHSWNGWKR